MRLAEIGKIQVVQEELVEYCCHEGERISNNKPAVLLGHSRMFSKIYKRLSDVSDPILIRSIRGSHECIMAQIFCSDEPHRALKHTLKGLALAPSPRKLRLLGRMVKLAAQSELRRLRKAFAR